MLLQGFHETLQMWSVLYCRGQIVTKMKMGSKLNQPESSLGFPTD